MVTSQQTTAGLSQIRQLRKALEIFAEMDEKVPLRQLVLLLLAAEGNMRPGNAEAPTMSDLASKLGNAAQSNVSRYMEALVGSQKVQPMGGSPLLRSVENPMNRRTKVVTMTSDGRALVRKLVTSME